MRFRNTHNGYEEGASVPFLWTLLFGALYFIYKGIWRHAIFFIQWNAILMTLALFIAGGAAIATQMALRAGATGVADRPESAGATVAITLVAFVLPFLIYPFFAGGIVRRHYLRNGWEQLI